MAASPQVNTDPLPSQLRALKGLTQQQLADLLGVEASFVSLCESNKRRPGLEVAVKWERVVGVPVSYWTTTDVQREGSAA